MDCNKTIDYLAEHKRMCDAHDECEHCPLDDYCSGIALRVKNSKQAIEIVQKWSDEHPRKTYLQDFFEKFPKAQSDSNRTPSVCRITIYGEVPPKDKRCDGREACKNCWNEPMEE